MTDNTPKTWKDGRRGYVIRTRPWESIIEHYKPHDQLAPMLRIAEAITSSPASSHLFAGTSMFDLLVSNHANFHIGDSTLRIRYRPAEQQFEFSHTSYSGHNDQKVCSENEALTILRRLLCHKYGVQLETPAA